MKLPKEFSLQEIAAVCGGTVVGDPSTKVSGVALSPMHAQPGELAFFFEQKLLGKVDECRGAAVMIPEGVTTKNPAIVVKRPLLAVQRMLSAVQPKRYIADGGVHPTAVVDPTAELGEGVSVGPLAVIGPKTKIGARTKVGASVLIGGEVTVGEDCIFHQGSMIADYSRIGNRVILQQGCSIGADGFSYVTERPSNMELRIAGVKELSNEPNPPIKIPNVGIVIIEDDVEVGALAAVDRATMGATVVGAHTKIDNLCMIAHNNRIGRECLIAGASALAGSCTLGDRVILAGQVGLKDHIKVGTDAIIQAKGGVMNDIDEGAVMTGIPAIPMRDKFTEIALLKRLPKLFDEFKQTKKRLEELEKALADRQLEKVNG